MNIKVFKRFAAFALCAVIAIFGIVSVSAASEYTISELDEMVVSLPDNMSAITRESKSTDKYFSVYGIDDYNTTMKNFENNNIYLQGMDSMSSVTITVTMTKTTESESIGNYVKLPEDELTKIRSNFLDMSEFDSCTPDQSEKLIWFIFNATAANKDKTINTYQANTVYDGMNINIIMQRNEGNVTSIDYSIFSQIVSSVDFHRGNLTTDILPYIIIGGALVILFLVIMIIVLARRIKKRRKLHKNDAILEELASKYNLKEDRSEGYNINDFDSEPVRKSSANKEESFEPYAENEVRVYERKEAVPSYEEIASRYSSDDEIDNIINTAKAYKESLNRESLKNNYGYEETSTEAEKKTEATVADISEDKSEALHINEEISSFGKPKAENDEPDAAASFENVDDIGKPDENTAENVVAAEDNASTAQPDDSVSEKYANVFFGTDTSSEDEDENDEELIKMVAEKTKFDNGYDFFEEAPKKLKGVISSSDIKNASDYDVIGEEEERAVKIQTEGEKTPGKAVEILSNIGNGLKSFGVHIGYFCKNTVIMIKRKRAAAKRRKAEAERRERERQRAIRAQQRREEQRENGGLVRVRSRGESQRAYPQKSRPQNRRPQTGRPQTGRPQDRRMKNGRPTQSSRPSSGSEQRKRRR